MNRLLRWLELWKANIFFKLLSGFFVTSLCIIIIAIFGISVRVNLIDNLNQVYSSQLEVDKALNLMHSADNLENELSRIRVDINTINRTNELVLTNMAQSTQAVSLINGYVMDFKGQRVQIDSTLQQIQDLPANFDLQGAKTNQLVQTAQNLISDLQALLSDLDRVVDLSVTNHPEVARTLWVQSDTKLSAITVNLSNFQDAVQKNQIKIQGQNAETVRQANVYKETALWILLFAGLLAITLALGLGTVFSYLFTRPVLTLKEHLKGLAEGDLVTSLEIINRDEFGDLGKTYNETIHRLAKSYSQLQEKSIQISASSAMIASASRFSATSSNEQAEAVLEATLTIEELNHTAGEIAEAASLVVKAAEEALVDAGEGQITLKESINSISQLKLKVQDIAEKILALNERSQRVGHIIEQITGIADQTHLLALNAAIESAAAGGSGKRFAVVAAEVKKLAERSRAATREVQEVLTEIQYATAASVMSTEQGMKQAEYGVVLAHRSGDANENIIQQIDRTAQLSNAISLATQQQRSASEQVVANMRQIAIVIEDAAASAVHNSKLATSLDEVAKTMKQLTSQFKIRLDETGSGGTSSTNGITSGLEPENEEIPYRDKLDAPSLNPEGI
ncbi:MAG: methyl-accepting chemotaxis protein [Chloroflexi bacterium]|uniref:Methyl-accepting chemotaxis protein n=1 Tax=Candidatus Chlorohelix allophototropha TaxID=3003348 RepID=A0A8T7M5X4_9CHLR|nr:methyl-accepting chemotaxis protein [Chloroflexota bacterium]WJW69421.1 methyl-accepting chemotaxis protein [Chloroflexota bacterium L227-S17]